jgi:two-component system cell cycle sensor histidine kinase PleC
MWRTPFILGHLRMTTRLLVAGLVVAGLLWWALDINHSARIVELVYQEQNAALGNEARRDRLRFDASLKAQFTLTRLLAGSRSVARHVETLQAQPPSQPLMMRGEADWLPPRSDRRGFPLIDHLILLDHDRQVLELLSIQGNQPPGDAFALEPRLLMLATEQAHIIRLNGAVHLLSVAPVGERGGRLVAISRLDSRFLAQVVGMGAAGGHVVVVADGPDGTVVASSNAEELVPGSNMTELQKDWLVAGMEFFDYGASEVVASFATLVPRARIADKVAPLLARERAQRTVLAVTMSGLFLGVLAWLALRLRRITVQVAEVTEAAFGTTMPVSRGDEFTGLVEQVENLSAEVLRSRHALNCEAAEKLFLMGEQMTVKAENERLRLVQTVTDLMGVGIIRIAESGAVAENAVMASFAATCGGLAPFVSACDSDLRDVVLTGSDGTERVFELLDPVDESGLLLVVDVTERRRAEEAVHSLALFPAQNPYPVLRIDFEGIVLHANPASAAVLGEWGCGAGRPVPAVWRDTLREAYLSGRQIVIELAIGERVLSLTMVPVEGAGYVNIYGADVTDRIAAERALAVANEGLERRVAERTRALARAKEQAELASRTKTEFLASVSHELRTPLNAIIGFSEVIAGAMFGPVGNARYQDYANDIVTSGRHLLAVINDILDVAKIEAGQMALSLEPVAVGEVVDAASRLVEARARAGGVRLETTVMDGLPEVAADRRRVLQVLVNLLSNAVKFTPAGGQVRVVAAADGAELLLTIADTGIGMDADQVITALEPFRQVDGSLARRYDGTGLGLPLAKSFAEMHGGRLDVDSEPGRGTTVRVYLPLSLASALAMRAAD